MTQERKHTPLKPCPFCGDTPRIENETDEVMGEIICSGCDVAMMACAVPPDLRAAWNRRAGEAELVEALEMVKTFCGDEMIWSALLDPANPNETLGDWVDKALAKARGDAK